MIKVADFYNELISNGIHFFAGVPDSLLKNICAYITAKTPPERNIITANEGGAIALAAGYNIATDNIPMIYMQNSGIGNAINPLLSLVDYEVYSIPMLLIIGWRGEPGIKDEPQHIKQGRVTPKLLESMEIPYELLDNASDFRNVIRLSVDYCKNKSKAAAILVKKGTFESFSFNEDKDNRFELNREEALENILKFIPENTVIVTTTGKLSRELFELREKFNQSHKTDFLTVGSMGHASQIALGIALSAKDKQVFCLDGDGAAIMHLGNYAIAGSIAPKNLKFIIFNNGAHDSVGGQPTIGKIIDLPKIAEAVNLKSFGVLKSIKELHKTIPLLVSEEKSSLVEVQIRKGSRTNLGRPSTTPIQNKELLKSFLKSK